MNCKIYEREIDCGHGIQTLVFVDNECISQTIEPKGHGWYTGDGNPEFLGKSPRQIGMKANRFKRWSNKENEFDLVVDILTMIEEQEEQEAQRAEYEAQLAEYGMA